MYYFFFFKTGALSPMKDDPLLSNLEQSGYKLSVLKLANFLGLSTTQHLSNVLGSSCAHGNRGVDLEQQKTHQNKLGTH